MIRFDRMKEEDAMGLSIVSHGIEELPYWEHGIRFFHVKGTDGEKSEFCQKRNMLL